MFVTEEVSEYLVILAFRIYMLGLENALDPALNLIIFVILVTIMIQSGLVVKAITLNFTWDSEILYSLFSYSIYKI